jgi:hypothetical protein
LIDGKWSRRRGEGRQSETWLFAWSAPAINGEMRLAVVKMDAGQGATPDLVPAREGMNFVKRDGEPMSVRVNATLAGLVVRREAADCGSETMWLGYNMPSA